MLTESEIITRMQRGEWLRWIPREMSARHYAAAADDQVRDLMLGTRRLSSLEAMLVVMMKTDGKLVQQTAGRIVSYEIGQQLSTAGAGT